MKAYHAHETEAVVRSDRTLRVEGVPFDVGEWVRVVLLAPPTSESRRHSAADVERSREVRRSLRGTVRRYDDPFEPAVPPSDWDALR